MDIFLDAISKEVLLEQLDWRVWLEMSQKEFDEHRQIGALLSALALDQNGLEVGFKLAYPVRCIYRGQQNPDFFLTSGNESLGIEATQIASEKLEAVRRMQFEEGGPALATGTLAAGLGNDRTAVNFRNAMLPGPDEIPPTAEANEDYCLKRTSETVDRKTDILRRSDFRGGRENWLLLRDRLSVSDSELERRVLRLRDEYLEKYWARRPRFSRIFVQDRQLRTHYLIDASTPLDRQIVIHTPG